MKRFHVHLSVKDLPQSIAFYNHLFGAAPTVQRTDYAKWMLDDPRVNFAVSQLGHAPGLDHLGFQVEFAADLAQGIESLRAAGLHVQAQQGTQCCYAQSDKGWVHDPQGIPWETFFTHGESTVYGVDRAARSASSGACCAPGSAPTPCCAPEDRPQGCCA
ncbi:MAG: VOC family protein [Betaproteobacteria bacterium]|nr:VOC family protein [Betaproteobacteria bacterium]